MSWVSDYSYSWTESLLMNVIRAGGNIPQHIAFVMDGNRRYASSLQLPKIEGHAKGFQKLADCLRWCLDMGIKEVTTFAFSIENYKRSEEEVNALFDLAREKFNKLLNSLDKLHEHGIRVRIIGNLSLLPIDLQKIIARAMLETEKNEKLFLNVAFSYTSRDELTQTVQVIAQQGGDILEPTDITERLVDECLYTRQSLPVDLLFRTSGETRLSDFLMWQVQGAVLYFAKILWPEITLWTFLWGIFYYQRANTNLISYRRCIKMKKETIARNSDFHSSRVQRFLQRLDAYRRSMLLKVSSN